MPSHTVTTNPTPDEIATIRHWQSHCYEQFTFDCTKHSNNYRQLFFDEYQCCVKWLRELNPVTPEPMGYELKQPVFNQIPHVFNPKNITI